MRGEERQERTSTVHAHLHEHADGTVHNHFHSHAGGDRPHEHVPDDSPHTGLPVPGHAHVHPFDGRTVVEARGLAYSFPHSGRQVFEDVSLELHAGQMTAILGNNGAGKSTLLNLLAHVMEPGLGEILVGGQKLSSMSRRETARHIAYVNQQQRVPHLSVYDEVLLGRRPHIAWSVGERDRAVVEASLVRLGLEGMAGRYCDELSGGERQKVYIARAIAQEAEVLLLDEPTSALDPKNQIEVLSVVREITTASSLATAMVIHDIDLALRFCDRFVLMRNGAMLASGAIEDLAGEALTKAYDLPMRLVEVDGRRLVLM